MQSAPAIELTLLRELAGGTFARLYLAEARGPGGFFRLIAVKILREQWGASPDLIARTSDEARLLNRLRHKNIVRVEETATLDGQLALLMEYVQGLDCKQIIDVRGGRKSRGPSAGASPAAFPARAAIEIAAATASALEAAHHRVPQGLDRPLKVVHRDIKPSNLMVSTLGEVKVLDFGTARYQAEVRSAQTREMRFGSLKYMSPERREGDRGEHPSDMYGLGLVLIEMLQGAWLPVLPLDAAEHDEALAAYIAGLPSDMMPDAEWDAAFRQLLVRLTAAEPRDRPSSADVTRLMLTFANEASGVTLASFAGEVVVPVVQALLNNPPQGELAGRVFQIPLGILDPSLPASEGPLVAQPVRLDATGASPAGPSSPDAPFNPPAASLPPAASPGVPVETGGAPAGPLPVGMVSLPDINADPGDPQNWTGAFARPAPAVGSGVRPLGLVAVTGPDVAPEVEVDVPPPPRTPAPVEPVSSATPTPVEAVAAAVGPAIVDDAARPVPPQVPLVTGGPPAAAPPRVGPDDARGAVAPAPQAPPTTAGIVSPAPIVQRVVPTGVAARALEASAGPPREARIPPPSIMYTPGAAPEDSGGKLFEAHHPRPPRPVPPEAPAPSPAEDDEIPPSLLARTAAVMGGAILAAAVLTGLTLVAALILNGEWLMEIVRGRAASPPPVEAPVSSGATIGPSGGTAPPALGGAPSVPQVTEPPPPQASEGEPPALAAVPVATAPGGGAPVAVRVAFPADHPQWVRLVDSAGAEVARGSAGLEAQAPAGSYTLYVKLVGRPEAHGAVVVAAGGAAFACRTAGGARIGCEDGHLAFVLE